MTCHSDPVEELALTAQAYGWEAPEREYRFHPIRRWRFDLAWPRDKLAIEYEGGQYGDSRHRSVMGFARDCEKYSIAALMGWRVVRITRQHLQTGEWFGWFGEGQGFKHEA